MNDEIMVSVSVCVYNHEKFLAKALDSILNQKTDFSFEIVVGEDCSKDNSRKILEEYVERYPDIIVPIYQKKNVGMFQNGIDVARKLRGKYWGFLDGDDYWCDETKLQKQVDYLEGHKKYSGCYHNIECIDEEERHIDVGLYAPREERDYTFDDFRGLHMQGHISSLLCRNIMLMTGEKSEKVFDYLKKGVNGDQLTATVVAMFGSIHNLPYIMSTHRVITSQGDSYNCRMYGKNLFLKNYNMYLQMCAFCNLFGMKYEMLEVDRYYTWGSRKEFKENKNFSNFIISLRVNIRAFPRILRMWINEKRKNV